ncbi:MAG: MarR family transcriptional regulator [Bacteroidales bacterium]|nr:MarR family transcriptional regulator [Bacteroidales bacterium]
MESKEKVLIIMAQIGDAVRPSDIAEKAGMDKKDLDKVIKVLKSEDKIFSPKRCFYQIKK